jgi:hypothetical protein
MNWSRWRIYGFLLCQAQIWKGFSLDLLWIKVDFVELLTKSYICRSARYLPRRNLLRRRFREACLMLVLNYENNFKFLSHASRIWVEKPIENFFRLDTYGGFEVEANRIHGFSNTCFCYYWQTKKISKWINVFTDLSSEIFCCRGRVLFEEIDWLETTPEWIQKVVFIQRRGPLAEDFFNIFFEMVLQLQIDKCLSGSEAKNCFLQSDQ